MEDRHYLSEPRPISGLALPTWEVDVMREGVGVPIMTLQINSQVLPPRQRKKKVVWKLPDTIDQAPKFGKEDKLRILELFKQQKKTLKREKRKSQPSDESERNDATDDGNPSNGFPDSSSDDSSANGRVTSNGTSTAIEPPPIPLSTKPPGFESLSIDDKRHTTVAHHYLTKKKGNNRNSELKDHPLPTNPPAPPPLPPPGLGSEVSTPLSPPGLTPLPPSTQPLPPPGISPTTSTTASTNPTDSVPPTDPQIVPSSAQHAALPEFVPRYFRVASQSPNPPGVELAQVVTQAYYFMLTHGHVQDLQAHYSPSATKSLTVGGAHAICASVQDIALQLQSLVGTVVAIRGVLHQTIPNPSSPLLDSILVVITGMSVRPHSLPFCHSIVLVPSLGGEGYQIQNDALCFLTTEAVGAV